MLYMVIEHYKNQVEVYRRFYEKGRMMPEGVSYVNSWVSEDGNTCYHLDKPISLSVQYHFRRNAGLKK